MKNNQTKVQNFKDKVKTLLKDINSAFEKRNDVNLFDSLNNFFKEIDDTKLTTNEKQSIITYANDQFDLTHKQLRQENEDKQEALKQYNKSHELFAQWKYKIKNRKLML